jgi:hypothetical protein
MKKNRKNKKAVVRVIQGEVRRELARSTAASRPGELLEVLGRSVGPSPELTRGREMWMESYDSGTNFSQYLEELDPTHDHDQSERTMDAFGRCIRAAGVIPVSAPERGFYAQPVSAMEEHAGTRALLPELFARMWRKASVGRPMGVGYGARAVYLTNDQPQGSILQPYATAATPRYQEIAPAIPLSELVAFNTGINTNTYRAFYLKTDVENTRMLRIVEGTEIPSAKLIGSERMIYLTKFGRKLEITYETLRRMPIDLVAFHIARIAVQAEADKVAAALSVLIGGDGNAGTAMTMYNLTTLDPLTTAGNLTLTAWLNFKMLFANPYALTTALSQTGPALKLQLLNTGSANIPLVTIQGASGFGGFRPINPGLADNVALGWTADAPANIIAGFDRRFAIERVFEIGASIQEVERWITRQVQVLTMTESEGFANFDEVAKKGLNLAA